MVRLLILSFTLFFGCDSPTASPGYDWHYQGRDCLLCHNTDLASEKHHLIAGTLYKSQSVTEPDNKDDLCRADLYVVLKQGVNNHSFSNVMATAGSANFAVLKSAYATPVVGSYTVEIRESESAVLLATSESGSHTFTSGFNPDKPDDTANAYSCNSCHVEGRDGPIYLNVNAGSNLAKCN